MFPEFIEMGYKMRESIVKYLSVPFPPTASDRQLRQRALLNNGMLGLVKENPRHLG